MRRIVSPPLRPVQSGALADPAAEASRREHDRALREIQGLPAAAIRVIKGIELADGIATPVPHGLGRPPIWSKESLVRNPSIAGGIVQEIRDGSFDRSKFVVLMADGYGATITVDVLVL